MGDFDKAAHSLKRGNHFPYDASDEWWHSSAEVVPAATDWAHEAARGILYDLSDRRGIKHGFSGVDEDVRAEIAESLAAIIRAAHIKATQGGKEGAA